MHVALHVYQAYIIHDEHTPKAGQDANDDGDGAAVGLRALVHDHRIAIYGAQWK